MASSSGSAEGALLPLSPIKFFTDEGAQRFSEAFHNVQNWAPQDSCLWALTMQSWTEIFFSFFFILIVYLQNRFQQLKCIYGLMEKASVGGFLALKEWEPHQWQREERVDYSHKAGQGAQGKQTTYRRVCRVLFRRAWQCLYAARLMRTNTVFQFFAEIRAEYMERKQMTVVLTAVISGI